MNTINFIEHHVHSRLKERKRLKKFLISIIQQEKKKLNEINFIFSTDEYVHSINTEFLQHDFYTDTITVLSSQLTEPIAGEVYISIERVAENAKTLAVNYQEELVRVIIHSTLHLCGYTDKLKAAKAQMFKKQEAYLKSWLVSRETN